MKRLMLIGLLFLSGCEGPLAAPPAAPPAAPTSNLGDEITEYLNEHQVEMLNIALPMQKFIDKFGKPVSKSLVNTGPEKTDQILIYESSGKRVTVALNVRKMYMWKGTPAEEEQERVRMEKVEKVNDKINKKQEEARQHDRKTYERHKNDGSMETEEERQIRETLRREIDELSDESNKLNNTTVQIGWHTASKDPSNKGEEFIVGFEAIVSN